jgi:tetratricopeptide (TPR) repeat protein
LKNRFLFIYPLLVLLLFSGCSTRKNTVVTRTYHNLTSKFNIFFNGYESYKKGIKKLDTEIKEDYTTVLPVFPYPNINSTSVASGDMDRAIKKAQKVILLHSLTVKPEYKRGVKTARQQKLYSKKQYNKWMDDAYLLMGKAFLMKGEYDQAANAFRYIIKEYSKEELLFEAQIWLARTLILKDETLEPTELLTNLSKEKKLNKKLIPLLNATYADFYIKNKKYTEAIPKLEIATETVREKPLRQRYTFILAQLYQKTGDFNQASNCYLKVIKMNPPYEMTFNARVNLAGVFESGYSNADKIRAQLYKFLKDEKNKDYQDQIYYALGNIDFKEGKVDEAIDLYKKSASTSISNEKQKARSFLAIADIKYNQRDYVVAQAYYDSSMLIIDETFEGYDQINARARSLNALVTNLNAVSLEDSVQFIAKMSESDRNMFIDKIIARVKEQEAEQLRKEQEAMLEQQNDMMLATDMSNRGGTTPQTTGSKWYFYNPSSKVLGENDFKLKWGKRKLEDNWRRMNKKATLGEMTEEDAAVEEKDTKKKVIDNKSREFYIANVPLTDSMMQASHENIRKGLYEAGVIYKDELSEYKLAIKQFEQIEKRYPNDPMVADASYQLYVIYRQLNNESMAERYKSLIISKFPNSIYANILTNPNYVKEIEALENKVKGLYEQLYLLYNQGQYSSVIQGTESAESSYKNNTLIPKFVYLKSLARGKQFGIDTLRSDLNKLIATYPKTEEANEASDIIAHMDIQHPEVKEKEEQAIAQEIYYRNDGEKHYFVIVVSPTLANANQLMFNLVNFNLDNYTNSNFSVKLESLTEKTQMAVVREFNTSIEALNYYDATLSNSTIYKDVNMSGVSGTFVINESNFNALLKDGSESRYILFFKSTYNR